MQNPTFHLDAVVKSKEALEDFDGPLSLILLLLGKNKVEIKDIKIAVILEQYLDYLAGMESMDLEVASEFITMASQLMYIKARTLLKGTEEIEEMDSLISSLEEMKRRELLERMKAAAALLAELTEKGEGIYVKAQEVLEPRRDYYLFPQRTGAYFCPIRHARAGKGKSGADCEDSSSSPPCISGGREVGRDTAQPTRRWDAEARRPLFR
jgi:hypothetical protein